MVAQIVGMDRLQERRLGEPAHRGVPEGGRQIGYEVEGEAALHVRRRYGLLLPDRGELPEEDVRRQDRVLSDIGVIQE